MARTVPVFDFRCDKLCIIAVLEFPGYTVHETAMNGNCLFESIADQLDRPQTETMACRQEIVQYIRQNMTSMVIITLHVFAFDIRLD